MTLDNSNTEPSWSSDWEGDYDEGIAARVRALLDNTTNPDTILAIILEDPGTEWFKPGALAVLAHFRDNPIQWANIKTTAKARGIFPPDLERAVDAYLTQQTAQGEITIYNKEGATSEPPIPFVSYDLPEFPTQVLPRWLQEFVRALAHATQTPEDLAGLLVHTGLATAMAKKVRVWIRQGYTEPVNLYAVVTMPPGSRKSPVFEAVMHPVQRHEEMLIQQKAPEIAKAEMRYNVKKGVVQRAQTEASREENATKREKLTEAAEALAVELLNMLPPEKPRLITDDTTPERLASLLCAQNGRMAVLSPEGGETFAGMSGRYTAQKGKNQLLGQNFGVYLKGFSGDTIRVDRVGRPAECVRRPALTVGITIQPDVLQGLQDQAQFRGRGLLGRFLYGLPPVLLGRRQTKVNPMPSHVAEAYLTNMTELLELPLPLDDDGNVKEHRLYFSPEAQKEFDKFEAWVEPLLDQFGLLGHMTDWGGKFVGNVARIIGLLHCAKHRCVPWEVPVAHETVQHAITLGKYLMAHARAAYGQMGADQAVEDAKYMLDWLRRDLERETKTFISRRDLHQGTKARFPRVNMTEPGLRLLCEHGFLAPHQNEESTPKKGRPASPTYDINPCLYDAQKSHNPQNDDNELNEANFEGFEDCEIREVDTEEAVVNASSLQDVEFPEDEYEEGDVC